MHCSAWNYLFLRSNGEFNCYCGAGENYSIFKDTPTSSAPVNIVDNVINGAYVGIRQKLKDGLMPFPDTCSKCSLFSEKKFEGQLYTDRIEIFQVEPSFRCSMNCTVCIPRAMRAKIPGPHDLPLSYFKKVVDNLQERNIQVVEVDFWGKGEPFLNPDTPEMVKMVKQTLQSRTTASTNGNFTWNDEIVRCGIDTIYFSIDGASQQSYGKYRDGDWRLAMDNLARAGKAASPGQRVIWKYILFDHNDSNAELLGARRMADKTGVELQFVFTIAPNPSRRFTTVQDLKRFWQAPESYPESRPFQPVTTETLEKIKTCSGEGIYIFGAAAIGLELKKYLEKEDVEIAGWLDSAPHKHGGKLDGLPIYSVDDAQDLSLSTIIIGSSSYVAEMTNQIAHLGVQIFSMDGGGDETSYVDRNR